MPDDKENQNNYSDAAQFVAEPAKPVEPAAGTIGAGGLGHEVDVNQVQANE